MKKPVTMTEWLLKRQADKKAKRKAQRHARKMTQQHMQRGQITS
jgi:hypothetical protein